MAVAVNIKIMWMIVGMPLVLMKLASTVKYAANLSNGISLLYTLQNANINARATHPSIENKSVCWLLLRLQKQNDGTATEIWREGEQKANVSSNDNNRTH